MQKQQLNSKGFGLIAAVIVIAVLIVLGGAGAYVYHRDHEANTATTTSYSSSKNSTQASNKQTTSKSTTITQATKFFTIQEWDIRAPYNGSLSLQYAVSSSNSMALSSAQLAAGGPSVCSYTSNGEAGILSRYLPTDTDLRPGIPASETAEQYVTENSSVPHATIGNYVYIYWGNSYVNDNTYNGPCTDKAAALQTIAAFSSLVPQFQAAQ